MGMGVKRNIIIVEGGLYGMLPLLLVEEARNNQQYERRMCYLFAFSCELPPLESYPETGESRNNNTRIASYSLRQGNETNNEDKVEL